MSFDLTNKNISDTFQNLLQKTGSHNNLHDLTGNPIINLTISGALSASVVSASTFYFGDGTTQTTAGGGSGNGFPFDGDAQITGSLIICGSTQPLLTLKQTGNSEFIYGYSDNGNISFAINQGSAGNTNLTLYGTASADQTGHKYVFIKDPRTSTNV